MLHGRARSGVVKRPRPAHLALCLRARFAACLVTTHTHIRTRIRTRIYSFIYNYLIINRISIYQYIYYLSDKQEAPMNSAPFARLPPPLNPPFGQFTKNPLYLPTPLWPIREDPPLPPTPLWPIHEDPHIATFKRRHAYPHALCAALKPPITQCPLPLLFPPPTLPF